jgi:hypothetical protein
MKNLLIAIMLVLAVATPTLAFTDYGTYNGAQCFDEQDENGICDIVYSQDYTCIMDNQNINLSANCSIVSPRFSSVEKARKDAIAKLKLILSAR